MNMNNSLYISAIRVPAYARCDYYQLHKLVYAAFPTKEAATEARVLYRFDLEEDAGYIYVQSKTEPDWSRIPEPIRKHVTGPVALVIPEGERLRFRLLAKPSLRIGTKGDPKKGVRRTIVEPDRQLEWFRRKGEEHGFDIETCHIAERVWHDTKNPEKLPNGSPKPLYAVQFDGILRVTDREKLLQAVANGIGPQKAFGFGLLSLAPLKE